MGVLSVIRIFCEQSPSLGTSVVNGLLGWAGVLGGSTAFLSALPAAVFLLIPSRQESLARRVNEGLGRGFFLGMPLGALIFVLFVTRVVS